MMIFSTNKCTGVRKKFQMTFFEQIAALVADKPISLLIWTMRVPQLGSPCGFRIRVPPAGSAGICT